MHTALQRAWGCVSVKLQLLSLGGSEMKMKRFRCRQRAGPRVMGTSIEMLWRVIDDLRRMRSEGKSSSKVCA